VVQSIPKNSATSEMFKQLPKVDNRPLGENWPPLVTLIHDATLGKISWRHGLLVSSPYEEMVIMVFHSRGAGYLVTIHYQLRDN
jgi:hypothetical protein